MKIILTLCVTALIATTHAQIALPVPAFKKESRILFQGDSITDGNRGRSADPNHILGHGYAFIIAAKYGADYPQLGLTFINRGISGNKVTDLAKRWQPDALDQKPALISILVGINDAGKGVPLEEFEASYDQLLADTRAAIPDVRLVLCAPFTLPVGKRKDGYDAWFTDVKARALITEKLASKHHAALVRLQPIFESATQRAPADYWIWDGVHPTYAGHQLIADEWLRTVRDFWRE